MIHKKIRKIIGIDARFYGPIGKGLGRYTKEVLDRIIEMDSSNDYVVFLSEKNFKEFSLGTQNVKKILIKARWYTLLEQFVLPFYIWKEKIDLMHFPHFNVPLFCPSKFVVTIHDLILTKHSTERASTLGPILYRIKNFAYKIIIKHAVWRSKKIIAVSYFTKNDIINQFGVDSKKIAVTYEGVTNLGREVFGKNDNITNLSYNNTKPFLLYVGNAYPHKNLEGLVKVFDKIQKKDSSLSLILVGREDYFFKRVKNFTQKFSALRGRVIFPGYVSDPDLIWFYKNAVAYIFPSLYEGFGLPPLEAMSYGCPVISSDKTSMPEILSDAAIYFNPENKDEIISAVLKIVKDETLRSKLIKKGYKQIEKYNWINCARSTFEVFEKELEEKS